MVEGIRPLLWPDTSAVISMMDYRVILMQEKAENVCGLLDLSVVLNLN